MKIHSTRATHGQSIRRGPAGRHTTSPWTKYRDPKWLAVGGALLVLFLVLWSALFGQHGYLALSRQQQELKRAEEQRDRLRGEQLRLKKELEELRTPQGIERVAREEQKLARPDEIVVTLPESGSPSTANPPRRAAPENSGQKNSPSSAPRR